MTQTLIGVSNNNLPTLEAALGAKVPVVRDYSWFGKPFPTTWAALCTGRLGVLSFKFRDANGAPFAATQVNAGTWDASIDAQGKALAALPAAPNGRKHIIIAHHESDSKASAAAGTPAQINDALVYWANRISKVPGFTDKCEIWLCVVGWNIQDLPEFATFIELCSGILIDQPYEPSNTSTTPANNNFAPRLAYLKQNYPNLRYGIGEYGCVPSPYRTTWMNDFTKVLLASGIDVACYWDNLTSPTSDFRISNSPDQATLIAAMKASIPPPAPQTVTVLKSDWAAMQSALATSNAALADALGAITVAGTSSLSDLAQASASVKTAQTDVQQALSTAGKY